MVIKNISYAAGRGDRSVKKTQARRICVLYVIKRGESFSFAIVSGIHYGRSQRLQIRKGNYGVFIRRRTLALRDLEAPIAEATPRSARQGMILMSR